MVPNDWARIDAPREFRLPEDIDALTDRYGPADKPFAPSSKSVQLQSILDYLEEFGANRVFVEAPYVDFDFRSEYSNLYARNFNPPSDKCERLLFFNADEFLGFIVARPSPKPIGRTAIAPPPAIAPFVCCLADHLAHPHGVEYGVSAWPFMSQDGVYGRCAHAAIWAIARYHHLQHNCPRHSIAAVAEASGTRRRVDKTSLSSGLFLHEVARAFDGLGLPTLPYTPHELPSGQDLEAVVCRYLNSGFPVALSTANHLSVLIGYGHRNGDLFFIRSDDNTEPYERVDVWHGDGDQRRGPVWEEGKDRLKGKWEMLLVPLPARIHVKAEQAEINGLLHFMQGAGVNPQLDAVVEAYQGGDLRFRTYAVDSARYKMRLRNRGLPDEVVSHHQRVPTSVWIWVTEIHRRSEDGKTNRAIGEIAIDATSHPRDPRPLFANMPGRALAWLEGEAIPRVKDVPRVELYESSLELRIDS